jgi:hypothetical protein
MFRDINNVYKICSEIYVIYTKYVQKFVYYTCPWPSLRTFPPPNLHSSPYTVKSDSTLIMMMIMMRIMMIMLIMMKMMMMMMMVIMVIMVMFIFNIIITYNELYLAL